MEIKKFIKHYENMLDEQLCDDLIEDSKNLKTEPGYVGEGVIEKSIRNCSTQHINKKFDEKVFKVVGNIINKYSQEFKYFHTGLLTEDTGYEYLIYYGKDKGEYKTHVDSFDLAPRVLSISLLLNDNYEGGDFQFFEGNDTFIIPKKKGSAIVFPSNFCFPHAVLPVSNGDRHSIVTWIR
mgnify:FL=1